MSKGSKFKNQLAYKLKDRNESGSPAPQEGAEEMAYYD
jgi:hypothetical protein|tara:strand:+ start:1209 stop:1322 length:114 start_codon:yes stop_codon:yes gene_type:complete